MEGGRPLGRVLTCTPVIRQSCGCAPKRNYNPDLTEPPSTATTEERRAIGEMVARAQIADGDGFIALFNSALAATTLAGGEPGKWNGYLSAIQHLAEMRGGKGDGSPPAFSSSHACSSGNQKAGSRRPEGWRPRKGWPRCGQSARHWPGHSTCR